MNGKKEKGVYAAQYYQDVLQKVKRNWRKPANAGSLSSCEVFIMQGRGGMILDVTFGRCPGSRQYKLSVETAVYKSEPIPLPADKRLFARKLTLKFQPY